MLYTEIVSITNTQICKEQGIIQNNNRFPFRNTHLGLSMLLVTLYILLSSLSKCSLSRCGLLPA